MAIANIQNADSGLDVRTALNAMIARGDIDAVYVDEQAGATDAIKWQAAIDAAKAQGGGVVKGTPGATYTFTGDETIEVDPTRCIIDLNQSTLDISGLNFTTNAYFMKVETPSSGEGGQQYHHIFVLRDGFILGAGGYDRNDDGAAIPWETATEAYSSRGLLFNVRIEGVPVCEHYSDRSYLIAHHKCTYRNNGRNVTSKSGATDHGENITYVDCSISGADVSIATLGGAWRWVNCSFDYSNQWFVAGLRS
jgi:hypothetical protein